MITFFVLKALQSNINFYLTPTQAIEKGYENLNTFKLGGMVKVNSVQKEGLNTKFYVTDYDNETLVTFRGVLPNLFKENSGVVALGYFDTNEESVEDCKNEMNKLALKVIKQTKHAEFLGHADMTENIGNH